MRNGNGHESKLWKVVEEEALGDLSQFHRPGFSDEVPLLSPTISRLARTARCRTPAGFSLRQRARRTQVSPRSTPSHASKKRRNDGVPCKGKPAALRDNSTAQRHFHTHGAHRLQERSAIHAVRLALKSELVPVRLVAGEKTQLHLSPIAAADEDLSMPHAFVARRLSGPFQHFDYLGDCHRIFCDAPLVPIQESQLNRLYIMRSQFQWIRRTNEPPPRAAAKATRMPTGSRVFQCMAPVESPKIAFAGIISA